jgi:hypothetical protein
LLFLLEGNSAIKATLAKLPLPAAKSYVHKDFAFRAVARNRRSTTPNPCFVYAISFDRRFIKFGHASNVRNRLSTLQTGCPVELEILAYIMTPNDWAAQELEGFIHAAAVRYHARGEWFLSCPKTLDIANRMNLPFEEYREIIKTWAHGSHLSLNRQAVSSQI